MYLTNTSRFLLLKHAAQALLDLTGIQQFRRTQQPLVKKEQQIHRQPKAHQKPLVTAHRIHRNDKHIHQQQIHCRQCRIKHKCCYSTKYFGELVKTETGKTAKSMINDRLLSAARQLLVDETLTITQVSQHLGFEYPQHFVRFFKAQTGKTPSEYRKTA